MIDKKALIIANGEHPPPHVIRSLCREADIIVCADGGANLACKLGVHPDIILGDLDSITRRTVRHFKDVPKMFIDDQNNTDLEKACIYCLAEGATSIHIVGGLGTRIDHATGTLGCLKKYHSRCTIELYDSLGVLFPVQGTLKLSVEKGQKISLIPLTPCKGVRTISLKFPLRNESLELGVREGISNEAISRQVTVSVKRGTLFLYLYRD